MNTIPIYTTFLSPRLNYVLDWLFLEQLKINYSLITDESELRDVDFFISYGRDLPGSLHIPNARLLSDKGIKQQEININSWRGLPTIFALENEGFSFDFFSAVFFLLSRYEEYYPFTPDKHGRYPATQSILYKNGWLKRPLLDEWIYEFKKILQEKSNYSLADRKFAFLPTYDIDIAWSYSNKGLTRSFGAYVKDIFSAKGNAVLSRTSVLLNRTKDPYDSFDYLHKLHTEVNCRPVFFVLSSLRTTAYDKNISPLKPAMQQLIRALAKDGNIGIHPSYYSNANKVLEKEKETLSKIIDYDIQISRQHYIKFLFPDTYRLLMASGITDDYSMGYGTQLGFRAATGQSFLWYDLHAEAVSTLRIHPFCFMDTTAHFDEQLSVADAFKKLEMMTAVLKKCNSSLTTIFHNFSLGTATEWNGWRSAYEAFLKSNYTTS